MASEEKPFSGRIKTNLHTTTCLWRWNRQRVPKRRHINFRRRGIRGITQKRAYKKKKQTCLEPSWEMD